MTMSDFDSDGSVRSVRFFLDREQDSLVSPVRNSQDKIVKEKVIKGNGKGEEKEKTQNANTGQGANEGEHNI